MLRWITINPAAFRRVTFLILAVIFSAGMGHFPGALHLRSVAACGEECGHPPEKQEGEHGHGPVHDPHRCPECQRLAAVQVMPVDPAPLSIQFLDRPVFIFPRFDPSLPSRLSVYRVSNRSPPSGSLPTFV